MKSPLAAVLLVFAASACQGRPAPLPIEPVDVPAQDRAAVAGSANAFGLDLYAQVRDGEGNRFLSPFSVWTALAMAHAGARGETAEEMARVLHISLPPDRLNAAVQSELYRLTSGGSDHVLTIANALWSQQEQPANATYQAILRDRFGAEARTVDFAGDTEGARNEINDWVAHRTADRIRSLFPKGSLSPETLFALTNAIYFLGRWDETFSESRTKEEPFHLADGGERPVRLMSQQDHFMYGELPGLKLLQMGYEKSPIAMLVALPDEPGGLAAVEASLTPAVLDGWTEALRHNEVKLWFPRFEFTRGQALGDTLKAMGLERSSDPGRADFSGISEDGPVFIQAVVHKAFVRVDEEGTEAAAATGMPLAATAAPAPDEPKTFRADHPFLFLLRDTRTGTVLFLGRLVEPTDG